MNGPPRGYRPPPADVDIAVLACLPVDTRDLSDIGIPTRKPTLTDTLGRCRNILCNGEVWIGEKQKYLLDNDRSRRVIVLCYLCAVKAGFQSAQTLGPDQDAPERT